MGWCTPPLRLAFVRRSIEIIGPSDLLCLSWVSSSCYCAGVIDVVLPRPTFGACVCMSVCLAVSIRPSPSRTFVTELSTGWILMSGAHPTSWRSCSALWRWISLLTWIAQHLHCLNPTPLLHNGKYRRRPSASFILLWQPPTTAGWGRYRVSIIPC